MKTAIRVIVATAVARCAFGGELSGQIFIVTKAHESKKLGLVAVAILDENAASEIIETVRAKTGPEIDRLKSIMPKLQDFMMKAWKADDNSRDGFVRGTSSLQFHEACAGLRRDAVQLNWDAKQHLVYLLSSRRYFKELPQPVAMTKTDADGNFSVEIPEGRDLLVAAAATRLIYGSESESYHWLVRAPKQLPSKIILSNDNLIPSPDSILSAGHDDGEDAGSVDSIAEQFKAITQKAERLVAQQNRVQEQQARKKKK